MQYQTYHYECFNLGDVLKKIETVCTKTEINNEWNINFLQNIPFSI